MTHNEALKIAAARYDAHHAHEGKMLLDGQAAWDLYGYKNGWYVIADTTAENGYQIVHPTEMAHTPKLNAKH